MISRFDKYLKMIDLNGWDSRNINNEIQDSFGNKYKLVFKDADWSVEISLKGNKWCSKNVNKNTNGYFYINLDKFKKIIKSNSGKSDGDILTEILEHSKTVFIGVIDSTIESKSKSGFYMMKTNVVYL